MAFLRNHRECLAGMDFFTVPTATFQLLWVFFVLHHGRRRVLHFAVTDHPGAQWIVQQLREAFSFDRAPRYVICDRDGKYGSEVPSANLNLRLGPTCPQDLWSRIDDYEFLKAGPCSASVLGHSARARGPAKILTTKPIPARYVYVGKQGRSDFVDPQETLPATAALAPSRAHSRLDNRPTHGNVRQRMATATKDASLTLRLRAADRRDLEAAAKMIAQKPGPLAVRFITEGVRRTRFPGIELRVAGGRSVAYLAGSRWPVWLLLDLLAELRGDLEATATHTRKPPALIRLALRYAEAYPEEIQAERDLVAQRSDYQALKETLPALEKL